MRKWVIIVLVLAAAVAVALVFYTFHKERVGSGNPMAFVSPDAELIFRIDRYCSPDSALRMADIPNWNRSAVMTSFHRVMSRLDSLYAYSGEWHEILSHTPLWMVHPSAARPDEWVLAVGLREDMQPNTSDLIKPWSSGAFSSREFRSIELFESKSIAYALFEHCLIWSTTSSAIEGSILARLEWAGTAPVLDECNRVSSSDAPFHAFLRTPVGRVALDLPYLSSMSWLGGFLFSDPMKPSVLLSTEGSFGAESAIPKSAVFAEMWSYPDFETGWRNAADFQPENAAGFWGQAWNDLADSCQCDLNGAFLSWRSGEWGTIALASDRSNSSPLGFIGIQDSLEVVSLMEPLILDSLSSATGQVYQMKYPELFRRNATSSLLAEGVYFAIRNGYLWYGADLESFAILRAPYLLDDPLYRTAREAIQPKGGSWIFQREQISSAVPLSIGALCGEKETIAMHQIHSDHNQNQVAVWTTALGNLVDEAIADVPAKQGWQLRLNEPAGKGNWLVRNHHTGHDELLIQDQSNALNLISADGKELWTVPLNGPVVGEVTQIDALRNGKLQLAFNTATSVYVIDRNGKSLPGFPIRLSSPASCAMKVADYDNSRNYRLLVGCENGQLLNLNLEGKATKGWKGYTGKGAIQAVDHVKIGSDDFLFVWSSKGKVSFLKRTGEVRLEPKGDYTEYSGFGYHIQRGLDVESTRLIYPRKKGSLVMITFGTGKEKVLEEGLAASANLLFVDVNSDSKEDIILSSGSDLKVFDSSAERMFGISMSSPILRRPAYFPIGTSDGRIGMSLNDGGYHLVNFQGAESEDFPINPCQALFLADMDKDGDLEILVINGTEVRILPEAPL